jgi:hypothetical protein
MGRSTRWLIFLPSVVLALFSTVTNAEPVQGLNATGYIVTDIPPTKSDTLYETCGLELENNINRSFDGEPFQDCPEDMFMVHYTGSIIIPAHDTIQFWLASDDGGTIKIGTDEFGFWGDQGCSATESGFLDLDAGIHSLDGWFYESGGGTCWMLAWQIDDEPWQIVPDEAFIANGESWSTTTVQTSTTTSVPETTVVETTVVSVQTSIYTSTSATTTLPAATTSVTVEQSTTTTEAEEQPVQQVPVWVEPEPIVETTTEDTEPIPVILEEVEEVTVETYPDFPEIVDDVVDEVVVDDTVADYIITEDSQLEEVIVEDTIVDILDEVELEEILEDVETITVEEAVAVAQDAQFVESLSPSQAVAVFDAVVVSDLSEEQIDAIVEAVQDAPTEVREAFEQEINIFAEGFDDYVPLGSNVPVGTRKTLIAVAAGTAAVASSSRRNK